MKMSVPRLSFPPKPPLARVRRLESYAIAFYSLLGPTQLRGQDGTWTNPAGGAWGSGSNWAEGVIASGAAQTADFSTLDLATSPTVSLNGARTIGRIVFGDATPSHD